MGRDAAGDSAERSGVERGGAAGAGRRPSYLPLRGISPRANVVQTRTRCARCRLVLYRPGPPQQDIGHAAGSHDRRQARPNPSAPRRARSHRPQPVDALPEDPGRDVSEAGSNQRPLYWLARVSSVRVDAESDILQRRRIVHRVKVLRQSRSWRGRKASHKIGHSRPVTRYSKTPFFVPA